MIMKKIPFLFLFCSSLAGCLVFLEACMKDQTELFPLEVSWTGKVLDGFHLTPLANQTVLLVQTSLKGPVNSAVLVFEDTLQSSKTDAHGDFVFIYSDPNGRENWFSVHTHHPDFLDKIVESRAHPALQEVEEDIVLKPKAWLRIRVLDVPEQTISNSGITFINLNVDDNFWPLSTNIATINPTTGDTTFIAYKPGGETVSFAYYDSDSMKMVSYTDLFSPFDTTDLLFTY